MPDRLLRALPRRRVAFIAGRQAARAAIHRLTGQPACPAYGADGLPGWPAGVTGSISHSDGVAIALAGSSARYRGIGVDVERMLDAETAAQVASVALTVQERARWGRDPFLVSLAFSAKESLYKALYPEVRRFFGFDSAEVVAWQADGHALLQLREGLSDDWPEGSRLAARFCLLDGRMLTRVVIPA